MGTSPSVLHITEFVFDFFSLQTMLQYFFFAVATKLFKRCNFLSLSFFVAKSLLPKRNKMKWSWLQIIEQFFCSIIDSIRRLKCLISVIICHHRLLWIRRLPSQFEKDSAQFPSRYCSPRTNSQVGHNQQFVNSLFSHKAWFKNCKAKKEPTLTLNANPSVLEQLLKGIFYR